MTILEGMIICLSVILLILIIAYMIGRIVGLGFGKSLLNIRRKDEKKHSSRAGSLK